VLPIERASAEALRTLVRRADAERFARWLAESAYVDAPRSWLDAWRRDAACADTDLDYFASDRDEQARCLAVCAACPVVEPCREAARYAPDPHLGVAGGMTGEARRAEDGAAGARTGWRRPPRAPDGGAPRSCACGCRRPLPAGGGATHASCRKRQSRERQAAA
jgi:WhiB family transcriptional regulator, redox-sensing transcriptional regulator